MYIFVAMKTKIVYVVASLDDDVYMEQAIVSAWSTRHYNPASHIEMVCDQDTFATLSSGTRAQYKDLFDKIHVREFRAGQSMMERSRWMKTSLRQTIDGDYLYLDTDTVVCADLSYVDDFNFDLGMAMDCNCEFRQSLVSDWVIPAMKKMYGMDVTNETQYFNSGVAFVRDCDMTKEFYKNWNELWVYSMRRFRMMKDQQPLMKANIDRGHVIRELSGDMNCQVSESIQYLHTAHIVHFLNGLFGRCNNLSPLYKELFIQVKKNGLTGDVKETILNCKSSFISPSMPVPREGAMLWRRHQANNTNVLYNEDIIKSNSYQTLWYLWQHHPKVMRFIENALGKFCKTITSSSE